MTARLILAAASAALAMLPAGRLSAAEPQDLSTLTQRAEPVSPESLALAGKLLSLERAGRSDRETALLGVGAVSPLLGPPSPGLLDAYVAAVAQSADDLQAMRDKIVQVYAGAYADAELKAMIHLLESPAGRSAHIKRLAALPRRPELTPEEAAAEQAFRTSSEGRSAAAKAVQVRVLASAATAEIQERISRRAVRLYCASHDCSPRIREKLREADERERLTR